MLNTNFHTIDFDGITELLEKQDFKNKKVSDFVEQLWKACSTTGFFYITNHGVEQEQIDKLFSCSREFFSESLEVKQQYYNAESSGSLGYSQMGNEKLSEVTPDQKEILNFRINLVDKEKYPAVFENNKENIRRFLKKTWEPVKNIFIGLTLSLELDHDFFYKAHNKELETAGFYRLLHYPPVIDDQRHKIRAGSHSDYGSLTLLFHETSSYEKLASSSGLQVLIKERHHNEKAIWEDVPAKRNCILVNIGDLLAFWTEGRLKSSVHRVIVPKNESAKSSRYIMTHFIHPNEEYKIYPIKSPIAAPFRSKEVSSGVFKALLGDREFSYGDTSDTYIQQRFSKTFH